jgi:hypothetical protein
MVFRSLVDVRFGAQLATPRSRLAALALAAIAAAWFWVLPPLVTSIVVMCPTDWSGADLVRHLWQLRLVEPDWVASMPGYDLVGDYLRWVRAETLARLGVVLVAWISGAGWIARRHMCAGAAARPKPPTPVCGGLPFTGAAMRTFLAALASVMLVFSATGKTVH